MANQQSAFLTGVVALVLGFALGVVGIVTLGGALSPSAEEAANTVDQQAPQVYGNR
jgi:hypothetical protein